jgi:hypothetical protein
MRSTGWLLVASDVDNKLQEGQHFFHVLDRDGNMIEGANCHGSLPRRLKSAPLEAAQGPARNLGLSLC